jgi:hypothetical protein
MQTLPFCDLHSWQGALHSCEQHTPSIEQKPLAHWLPEVHPTPGASLQLPIPSHVIPMNDSHPSSPVFSGRFTHIVPFCTHPWHGLVHGTAQQTSLDEQFPLAHMVFVLHC